MVSVQLLVLATVFDHDRSVVFLGSDGPEKVKLTAACRMIATQLKRMLQLMKDRTEADEASIAYLLLMNKVRLRKLANLLF
jgi:hypothetical protein